MGVKKESLSSGFRLVCEECEASALPTPPESGRIRHKKWCDSKAQPTTAQVKGDEAAAKEDARADLRRRAEAAGYKVNLYPGVCGHTGEAVSAGAGFVRLIDGAGWVVFASAAVEQALTGTAPLDTQDSKPAPEGHEWYCGPGATGGRVLLPVGHVAKLRAGGHSWADIGSGNHDF